MFEILIKALVSLIDGIMAVIGIAHDAERHLSDSSRVGRSKMDNDAHNWRERIFNSWAVFAILLLLFIGGSGYVLWNEFFSK